MDWSIELLLSFVALFVGLAGGAAIIWKVVLPHFSKAAYKAVSKNFEDIEAELKKHQEALKELEEKKVKDHKAIQAQVVRDKAVINALFVVLEETYPGEASENINDAKKKLRDTLISNM